MLFKRTAMGVSNVVLLFILVWAFTAVCQAYDAISVRCEDVTGTVDEEVTFTCSVSLEKSGCCVRLYRFLYPEKYSDSEICKEEFPRDPCKQRNSFTCRFSSTTAMTGQFRIFVQTTCGATYTEFTVNITETSKPEPVTKAPGKKESMLEEDPGLEDLRSRNAVIAAVMGCFIFIIIIIIVTILCKKKLNYSKPCGFQRRIFLGHKHDDNNSNFQEQNPESNITDSAVRKH